MVGGRERVVGETVNSCIVFGGAPAGLDSILALRAQVSGCSLRVRNQEGRKATVTLFHLFLTTV